MTTNDDTRTAENTPMTCVAKKGKCPCSLVTATGGTCGVFGPAPTFAQASPYLSTPPESLTP